MRESAVQMPDLIHTAIGGKRMARRPRKMSPEHMIQYVSRDILLRALDTVIQC